MRNTVFGGLAALALLVGAAGCFNPFRPLVAPFGGIPEQVPALIDPEGTIKAFRYAWNHRDYPLYTKLFADEFQFVYTLVDSAGNTGRQPPLTREEELDIAKKAFIGGGAEPPATNITLTFDQNLRPHEDSKHPGDRLYREIVTNVDLSITVDTPYRVTGNARFHLVRADADSGRHVPSDLPDRPTAVRDSTRWFIYEWDDETLGDNTGAPSALLPALPGGFGAVAVPAAAGTPVQALQPRRTSVAAFGDASWGYIQSLYLDRP